ncbi:hypothetical protein [Lacticaseibacillus absianus]|uniref:hypothetical protein n=1 Tax=Lacticaseibacillus absianus TaxID=2729623 RepID=UPI0015C9FD57|nr:hypothetical protein [Lacticaseibacillus absianus]
MQESKYTPISRGWLGFWSLVYSVLLIVGAVGLGFALTFGRPTQVYRVLVDRRAFAAIQTRVNNATLAVAQGQGLELEATTNVTPEAALKAALRTGLAISSNFNAVPARTPMVVPAYVTTASTAKTPLDLTPLTQAITAELVKAAKDQGLAYSGTMRQQTETKVATMIQTKITRDLMLQGWGLVYPMLTLMVQTAAIVGAILALIVLAIMLYCSHSWQRWFKVAGRVTYVIAFLGGLGAMIAGSRTFVALLGNLGGLDQIIWQELFHQFAPTWQRVAGITVVVGLSLALVGQVLRALQRRRASN